MLPTNVTVLDHAAHHVDDSVENYKGKWRNNYLLKSGAWEAGDYIGERPECIRLARKFFADMDRAARAGYGGYDYTDGTSIRFDDYTGTVIQIPVAE